MAGHQPQLSVLAATLHLPSVGTWWARKTFGAAPTEAPFESKAACELRSATGGAVGSQLDERQNTPKIKGAQIMILELI
ncbi:hypothetical protein [Megasphaera sp.]|uniref:hypothetical protein n=1 Tax=Megasphaera sp. TaxID=2023260 RepID=UPI0025BA5850|nr:hypothetical protein [Megasphaera sp.]MCF0153732.1 hypothetical protein [Megasphaera sp.]